MKRMVVAVLAAVLGVVGLGALALTTTSTASAAPVAAKATPTQWKFVSAAGDATCAIDAKQKLYCWGANYYGQLGIGSEDSSVPTPTKVDSSSWLTVRTSYYTSCGIKTDHSAWCWGYNAYGELGNGTDGGPDATSAADSNVPVKVKGGIKWARITAGYINSCGISTAGALYCTGGDYEGMLGDGEGNTQTNTMRRIGTATNWDTVTPGYYHSCALKTTGKALCWGEGDAGATGTGANDDTYSPVVLPGTWKSINTIGLTTCGVTTTGVSKCWGYNDYGQVGNGNSNGGIDQYSEADVNTPTKLASQATNFVRVRGGYEYSCGITPAGGVRCFGANDYGQFGDGQTTDEVQLDPVTSAGSKTGWTQLSFGDFHACGIRNGGKLLCWGYGGYGQLGNGDDDDSNTPVVVGSSPAPTEPPLERNKGSYKRGPMFDKK